MLNHYFQKYFYGLSEVDFQLEDAGPLCTVNRFDVALKAIYASSRLGIGPTQSGPLIYRKVISGLNGGRGADSTEKTSVEDYISAFDGIIDAMRTGEFEVTKSGIPIDRHGVLIDGSHRAASAGVQGKRLLVARAAFEGAPRQTLGLSINRFHLSEGEVALGLLSCCQLNPETRLFFLFPRRDRSLDSSALSILRGYFNCSDMLTVKNFGGHWGRRVFETLYAGATWIGSESDQYKGANWKAGATGLNTGGHSFGNLEFMLVQPKDSRVNSVSVMKGIKEEMRKLYGIGFHSVHSTDSVVENIRFIQRFCFPSISECERVGLPFGKSHKASRVGEKWFSDVVSVTQDSLPSIVVVGGSVMAALGLREASDLDVIHHGDISSKMDSHNRYFKIFLPELDLAEIIYNPDYHFVLDNGVKMLNPALLLMFKERRYASNRNKKDLLDIALLNRWLGVPAEASVSVA